MTYRARWSALLALYGPEARIADLLAGGKR